MIVNHPTQRFGRDHWLPKLPPGLPRLPVRRFSLDEYHRMTEIGMLHEDEPFELLNGWITFRSGFSPPHAFAVTKLMNRFFRLAGEDFIVSVRNPITIPASDSEPEPDVVIAAGPHDQYFKAHPRPWQVALVIEVADESLETDLGVKLEVYAAARLPEYWVVNLIDRRVEVYTQPRGGKSPAYRGRRDYGPRDSVPVVLAGKDRGAIPVREILPR